jgi:hypothetical protein
MPYFPTDDEDKVVVELKGGNTITLIEKQMSVADRKAMLRRAMSMQYDFEFKTKQAKAIQEKIDDAGLDRKKYDMATAEQIMLADEINPEELYATVLSMRFKSWDCFTSKADYEAGNPVPMDYESIKAYALANPKNFVLLSEILEGIKKHDGIEEKKDETVHASGKPSTVKA